MIKLSNDEVIQYLGLYWHINQEQLVHDMADGKLNGEELECRIEDALSMRRFRRQLIFADIDGDLGDRPDKEAGDPISIANRLFSQFCRKKSIAGHPSMEEVKWVVDMDNGGEEINLYYAAQYIHFFENRNDLVDVYAKAKGLNKRDVLILEDEMLWSPRLVFWMPPIK